MEDKEILQEAINRYGVDAQIDMAIEEMSELTQALLKLRRKDGFNHISDFNIKEWENVYEEIEDVRIMIEQLDLIFDDGTGEKYRKEKIRRLKDRLKL